MVDRLTPSAARSAILVIDHGSRAAEANESLGRTAELVRARLPAGSLVGIAHMELAAPTVAEGVAALVAAGATEVVVVDSEADVALETVMAEEVDSEVAALAIGIVETALETETASEAVEETVVGSENLTESRSN